MAILWPYLAILAQNNDYYVHEEFIDIIGTKGNNLMFRQAKNKPKMARISPFLVMLP